MNDNYTIIRELQNRLKHTETWIKICEDMIKTQNSEIVNLKGNQTQAVQLLNSVEFKTNKVFESHVKKAINLLENENAI